MFLFGFSYFRIFVIVEDLSSEFQEIDRAISIKIDDKIVEYLLEMSQFEDEWIQLYNVWSQESVSVA